MVLVVITGGNGDVGVECCKQLAAKDEVDKIIITCRTEQKAKDTIESLLPVTKKESSFFDYVIMDLTNYDSVVAGAKSLPDNIDRLCLNVGGLGKCELHESGATDGMVMNTLGHALLFDKIMEQKKLAKDSRVINVGSEVSHDIWSFTGLLPHYYGRFRNQDIEWAIGKSYSDAFGLCLPVRRQLGDYKNAKIIGQLFFAHMAKEHPDIFFMTISPGALGGKDGNGTGFSQGGFFPLNVAMKHTPWIFRLLGVTHTLKEGVERYMDGVLTGAKPKWDSGAMVMSKKDGLGLGLFFWGGKGGVADIRPQVPYLKDEDLAEKASVSVRKWLQKWQDNSFEDNPNNP